MLISFEARKNKWPKQDSQNWLRSLMHEAGVEIIKENGGSYQWRVTLQFDSLLSNFL
jgi:hypothetical protein